MEASNAWPLGRLAEFLKELPGAIKRAEPSLALYTGEDAPLGRRVGLQELQTNFVYSTVLAKKCKVRQLIYPDIAGDGSAVTLGGRSVVICTLSEAASLLAPSGRPAARVAADAPSLVILR